jgi:hypothetical protein
VHYLYIGKGSLDNGYLDNLNNEFLNKYKKILKREKTLWICSSTCKLMVNQISLSFDSPSKTVKLYKTLVFDGVSNDN